jgi:Beta-lactamase enzyme family
VTRTQAIPIVAIVVIVAVVVLALVPTVDGMRRAASLGRASALFAASGGSSFEGTRRGSSTDSSAGAVDLRSLSEPAYRKVSAVPTSQQVKAATAWASHRRGIVAFAVIDTKGRFYGYHANRQYVSASVVKAMLLVAYLRSHKTLGSGARGTLSSMIRVSDNNAADVIYRAVGDAGLYSVARKAGMKDFSVNGWWTNAQLTPADQARFFMSMDALIPSQHVAFARRLLSTIASYQSWGTAQVGRGQGWEVYFKGGWRSTSRGQLVHQSARLEKSGERIAIVVMTDGNPSMSYGIETIRGIAVRLLGARP